MVLQRRHLLDDLIGVGADHVMMHHAFECPNHQALICVSTAPFIGMVSPITTSKALMRSVVSSSTRSSPTA